MKIGVSISPVAVVSAKQSIASGPTNTAAPVASGTAERGETLSVTNGAWEGEGSISYAYQWQRNGAPIAGATNSTYVLVAADDNTNVRCSVTATDDNGSATVASNTLGLILGAISNLTLPVITGTAAVDQTLSVSNGTWQGAPTITYTYQWQRDGVNILSATSSTYTLVSADLAVEITCEVTATNSIGSVAATSPATDTVTEPVPVNTVAPALTGIETVGQTLSVSNGTWTSASIPTYTYQWQRDNVDIPGATSNSYSLVNADETTIVHCVVTAANSVGGASTNSNATGAIAYPALDWEITGSLTGKGPNTPSSALASASNATCMSFIDSRDKILVANLGSGRFRQYNLGTTGEPDTVNVTVDATGTGVVSGLMSQINTEETLWYAVNGSNQLQEVPLATSGTINGTDIVDDATNVYTLSSTAVTGMKFSPSGEYFFYNTLGRVLYCVPLSTPFDFSSAGSEVSYNYASDVGPNTNGRGLDISNDGMQLLLATSTSPRLFLFDFDTAFDITTLTLNSLATINTNPQGILVGSDNTINVLDYVTNTLTSPIDPPVNTVLPAITGTEEEDQTLTCSTGTWTSDNTLSYAYQWKRAGTPISGATSSTYMLVTADVGNTVTCVVTATNTAGSTSAESAATGTIAEAPDGITGLEIDIAYLSNWIAVVAIGVTVGTSTDDVIGAGVGSHTTTAHGGAANIVSNFAGLSNNQYGTNSDYDGNDSLWNTFVWNDTGGFPVNEVIHWSDSESSGMKIFIKWATPQDLRDVRIRFLQVSSYGNPRSVVQFKDQSGNIITPATSPASDASRYGGSTADKPAYKWTF